MLWAKSCLYRLGQLPWQQGWDQAQTSPIGRWGGSSPYGPNRAATHTPASPCKETGCVPCRSRVPEPACRSQTLPSGAAGAPAGGEAGSTARRVCRGNARRGLRAARRPALPGAGVSGVCTLPRLGWHWEREDAMQFGEHVAGLTALDAKR